MTCTGSSGLTKTCGLSDENRDWNHVEVDRTHNLALGKPTKQSSSLNARDYGSSNAVDGNRQPHAGQRSCAITNGTVMGSWWEVNLEAVYEIGEVVITSRGDCCGKSTMWSSVIF